MKENWQYKKLEEISEINYGTRVVQKKDQGTKYDVYGGGGKTFKVDKFNRENCFIISRFAMSPKCTRFVSGKFFLNDSGLSVNVSDDNLLQNFLDKFLEAKNDFIYSLGKGAAQRNLDIQSFRKMTIPIPPISEQEKIVEELDLLSGIIDKQKQQLKELDILAHSFFYSMFGDPVTNEKNWPINTLGKVLKTTSGGTPSTKQNEYYENGTIPWINSGDLHKTYIHSASKFITESGLNNSSAKLLPINTVLLAMYGATVGEASILKMEASTNQAVCGIYPSELYSSVFLYFVLKYSKEHFIKVAIGGAQPNISQTVIKAFKLISPPLELQNKFTEKIEWIEKQKERINKSIVETQKLFDYSMDKYFG